jgi:hypothetical protein
VFIAKESGWWEGWRAAKRVKRKNGGGCGLLYGALWAAIQSEETEWAGGDLHGASNAPALVLAAQRT